MLMETIAARSTHNRVPPCGTEDDSPARSAIGWRGAVLKETIAARRAMLMETIAARRAMLMETIAARSTHNRVPPCGTEDDSPARSAFLWRGVLGKPS